MSAPVSPDKIAKPLCFQINLQAGFGGGEVFTAFFSKALLAAGWETILFARPNARFFKELELDAAITVHPVGGIGELLDQLPPQPAIIVSHALLPAEWAIRIRSRGHFLIYFAHMPLYDFSPETYRGCDLIFAVSQHVIDSIKDAKLDHYYPVPFYGVADFSRSGGATAILERSVYDWDKRKFRDRVLSYLYPVYFSVKPKRQFTRRKGLTLGIVSRLTPIKQFPLMFELLVPVIRKYPSINIEIFGSGGYASVRDLKRALAPVADQVRWWGHQRDVKAVYPQLDFLLAGLPEKEALGLNIIEAQVCGTPVLAVNAPPFIETVLEGETGFFYTDPRRDGGRDFARLLDALLATGGKYPDPRKAMAHLERFSLAQFAQRVKNAMTTVHARHIAIAEVALRAPEHIYP